MKMFKWAAGLTVGLCAASANASNLSYSMVGLDLTSTRFEQDVDLGAVSFSGTAGATLYGGYQFNDNFFIQASVGGEGNSDNGFELTTSVGYLAVGFALPVGEQTDVVFRLASVSVAAEICYDNGVRYCIKDDDSGVGAAAGIRYMATSNVELNADYIHVDLNEFDDSDTVGLGAAYWFDGHSSLRGKLSNNEGDRKVAVGYRYSF